MLSVTRVVIGDSVNVVLDQATLDQAIFDQATLGGFKTKYCVQEIGETPVSVVKFEREIEEESWLL